VLHHDNMCTPLQLCTFIKTRNIGTDVIVIDSANVIDPGPHLLFVSLSVPSIQLVEYIERIVRYADLEPPNLVVAAIYILRLRSINPLFLIAPQSLHRLLATTIICAQKMNSDTPINIKSAVAITGICSKDLIRSELCILEALKWQTFVSRSEYNVFYDQLVNGATP
jgi:hypothetical protein